MTNVRERGEVARGAPALRKLMFNISTMEELGEVLSSRDHFRENIQTALLSLMGSVPVAGALLSTTAAAGPSSSLTVRAQACRQGCASLPPSQRADARRRRRPLVSDRRATASWPGCAGRSRCRAGACSPLRFRRLVGASRWAEIQARYTPPTTS
jgi:hypothetical protein